MSAMVGWDSSTKAPQGMAPAHPKLDASTLFFLFKPKAITTGSSHAHLSELL